MPPVTPRRIFATPEFCLLTITPAGRLRRAAHKPRPEQRAFNDAEGTRAKRACGLPRPKRLAFRANAKRSALALRVAVLELALGDFFEGHRQVVLGARLDERRREVVEGALTQLVVVVVDLPGALRGDDDKRV